MLFNEYLCKCLFSQYFVEEKILTDKIKNKIQFIIWKIVFSLKQWLSTGILYSKKLTCRVNFAIFAEMKILSTFTWHF